jgi:ABC-type phosphate transport system substrate-binding protein
VNGKILTLLCLLGEGGGGAGSAADLEFVVIVNTANPAAALPRDAVAKIFLKTSRSWDNGNPAKPVDLPVGAAAREAFSREVLHQSAGAIDERWQRQIFSGRDVPPPRKGSDAEVIQYVSRNPGGIGYVAAGSSLPANVKKVQIQ